MNEACVNASKLPVVRCCIAIFCSNYPGHSTSKTSKLVGTQ